MARIRTIKPEFFRHEELFAAELESGLPLRVAFAGLWTAADREGRFQWKPRQLKLDCLPYDDLDFSRVLDALTTRGFLLRYADDSGEYGCIPSWGAHQVINNRESESVLPAPDKCLTKSTTSTREPRVDDACPTPLVHAPVEGKGKEGKGREGKESATRASRLPADLEMPAVWFEFCQHERPDLDAQHTFAKFRDYWTAKPGKAGTKVDWLATWRNWVREERRQASRVQPVESFAERDERKARERYEEFTGKRSQGSQAATVIDITPASLRVTA